MKKLSLLALTFLSLLTISCTQKEILSPQKCTLDDLVGTWIWVSEDGHSVPNSKIEIGTIKADGTEEFWSIKDGKWTKTDYPITVSDGIIHFGDVGECYIVSYDNRTLVIESKKDKTRYTSSRVLKTENKQLYGTWTSDSYVINETLSLSNFQITINDDGTYVMTYDGTEPITGKYYIFNEFMIYQSDVAGSLFFSFDMDKSGPICRHMSINDDGTFLENILLKKLMKEFTLDDVIGTWLTVTKDNHPIIIPEMTICNGDDNSGHTVISGVINGKWVSNDVQLTVKDNVVTRVINGVTDSYTVIYYDPKTIVWKSHQDGSVVTRKNIRTEEDYSKLIPGYWKSDEMDPIMEGNTTGKITMGFIAKGDSAIIITTDQNGVKETKKSLFKIYGDLMVLYDDAQFYTIVRISFGYDAERREQYTKHQGIDKQGNLFETLLYKPDLESKLSGGWMWTSEDGVVLPTYDFELSFYNSITRMHDYQTFSKDAEHILEPYYVEGRKIFYPEDTEIPYETIMKIDDQELVVEGPDGIIYGASRISKNNPLNENIIGTWHCQNFKDRELCEFTQIFDKNGLITFIENNGAPGYGTYRLYNNLLVIQFRQGEMDMSILWVIKDFQSENGTMTFYRLLEDGTSLENVLTKQ